jgi:hypothetical protein
VARARKNVMERDMTPHIWGPHRPTDGPSCPRYSVATNAALVRPVRCLPPLLQLAAVVRGGAAPLLSSTNHGPGWGTSGPEQAALRPAQPAQSPHTGNYRGPISSWCRLVPWLMAMSNSAEQSKVTYVVRHHHQGAARGGGGGQCHTTTGV